MPQPDRTQPTQAGPPGATDIVTQLQGIIKQLTAMVANGLNLITTISKVLPRITGTFTLGAAASTAVAQPAITSTNSVVKWTPTNAAAGTLEGSAKALYLSSITPGTGFTVATASGGNAAGTETYQYTVENPS